MPFRPITLSVKRGVFRADDSMAPVADEQFQRARPQVLKRDDYTCQFCEFRAKKYQEVHHLNDDHAENDPDNLITACALCHLDHHVGFAGATGKASLIYLGAEAGIGQGELNQLVRTLWIAKNSADREMSLLGINILSRLLKGTVGARRSLGTADPIVLGDYMLGMNPPDYASRAKALGGYYLLPSESGYARQIQYWQEHVFNAIPTSKWVSVARQRLSGWAENQYGDSSDADLARYLDETARNQVS